MIIGWLVIKIPHITILASRNHYSQPDSLTQIPSLICGNAKVQSYWRNTFTTSLPGKLMFR